MTTSAAAVAAAPTTTALSVFVMTLLKKYPSICTQPFSTVVESWRAVDERVMAYVDIRERQALNHTMHLEWVDRSPKYTIAHWAATNGFLDVLHAILERNSAQLVAADNMWNRPMHWAAKGGQVEALAMLVEVEKQQQQQRSTPQGAGPTAAGKPPLPPGGENGHHIAVLAAQYNHVPVLKWMLGQGGALRDMLPLPEKSSGRSALHVAAQCSALDALSFLINEASCPVDCVDRLGRSLAHFAAESGRQGPLQLLQSDAKSAHVLMHLDARGASPLHYASRNPRGVVVPFLHATCGLDLALLDAMGNAPAVWAVLGGKTGRHIECLDYMASHGVRLGALTCGDGRSLLRLARDTYGTQCRMFAHLQALGVPE